MIWKLEKKSLKKSIKVNVTVEKKMNFELLNSCIRIHDFHLHGRRINMNNYLHFDSKDEPFTGLGVCLFNFEFLLKNVWKLKDFVDSHEFYRNFAKKSELTLLTKLRFTGPIWMDLKFTLHVHIYTNRLRLYGTISSCRSHMSIGD